MLRAHAGVQVIGLISCTGTNFMLRAEAWQEVDGFPEHTITEDFAMGIELTLRRWCCVYVPAPYAFGEAPETTRKVPAQGSISAHGLLMRNLETTLRGTGSDAQDAMACRDLETAFQEIQG